MLAQLGVANLQNHGKMQVIHVSSVKWDVGRLQYIKSLGSRISSPRA